ncbi:putative glycosyl transferase [Leclercia adecarboxylata]|uniref:Putative glycosyl transferase n=1 Tax=Leclercia adecarboxylata TaxID=83655 RepID=A0A4U9I274_9ENTR|nr:putative glycosyl transferase [Leclercia adecarboxylata]
MSHSGNTMTTRPLISIYMPTWNRQQLAIRAIKSVLRQDYDHWELIIVDDCSSLLGNNCSSLSPTSTIRGWSTPTNAINSGACAVRNQAIMPGQRPVPDRH